MEKENKTEIVKYVLKQNSTKYYKPGNCFSKLTKDPLKAKSYKTIEEAKKVKKIIDEFWRKNSAVYQILTGEKAPDTIIKKLTISINEE